MNTRTRTEIFVVIKEGSHQYYLLKVQRRGLDVYCFPPHLGMHYSLHESGEAHIQHERDTGRARDELPIALIHGEAGTPIRNGIIQAPLSDDLGVATGICSVLYPIDSLSSDFREFARVPSELFVIDKDLFPKETTAVLIGIWAVPHRNQASFNFNNPDIPDHLLYKTPGGSHPIWIYAEPIG